VVATYYVFFAKVNLMEFSLMNNDSTYWVSLLFPLFLIPYMFGIIKSIRKSEVFVFDGETRDLRKNGKSIIRFDQLINVQLKAVNGNCEELRLSVQGEDNISVEIPLEGSPNRVAEAARAISDITNVTVLLLK
jgi:uncharacterized protein with ACT and thioredoxin-like domain